jgi:GT2 family glycosyltransferase
MLVRRSLLERLGGFDERFFLYCEDMDLCWRVRDLGFRVLYEPTATASHAEGQSAPRTTTLPILVASRVKFARKHFSRSSATLLRVGLALSALGRLLVSRGGGEIRAAHMRSLRVLASQ